MRNQTVDNAVNGNLSNLTIAGKNLGNWCDNISNYAIEIPQDINLELSSGTLTLKAGSKVRAPNGVNTFETLEIENDVSITESTDGQYLLCVSFSGTTLMLRPVENCVSGAGATTTSGFAYDITTNKINNYDINGDIGGQYRFPIAAITVSSGSISSIDKIFNGFGYIGSAIFILDGVKFLTANGRNENGTLKGSIVYIGKVVVRNLTLGNGSYTAWINKNKQIGNNYTSSVEYREKENYVYSSGTYAEVALFVNYKISSGKIKDFNTKRLFHAADYNEVIKPSDFSKEKATTTSTASAENPAVVIENYKNGNDWYRIWSDGWIEQGGVVNADSYTASGTITFLKPFSSTGYHVSSSAGDLTLGGTQETQGYYTFNTRVTTGINWKLRASSEYFSTRCSWACCGY